MNTSELDPRLIEALAPALDDLRHTTDGKLELRPEDWSDSPDQITAMLWDPDGSGTGVSVMRNDSKAQRIVAAADQLQEAAIDALRSFGRATAWPPCPQHPGGHPLRAALHDGKPSWVCPALGEPVAKIGGLGQ